MNDSRLLATAQLILDGVAINEAVQAGDMDEARFRCHLISAHPDAGAFHATATAAAALGLMLGPAGTLPHPGYNSALRALSHAIDALPFRLPSST